MLFGQAFKAIRRLLTGVWVVEVDGVEVATFDTEETANREAAEQNTAADGLPVVVRHVWRARTPKGGAS